MVVDYKHVPFENKSPKVSLYACSDNDSPLPKIDVIIRIVENNNEDYITESFPTH
jgi:hypothetical protein